MAERYDKSLYQSPIYRCWSNMKTRCTNQKNAGDYARYGARGITVCEAWKSFAQFNRDMGPSYKSGLTLDRIDNNVGYSKDNCRWATPVEQANNRRNNKFFTIAGETKTLAQWIRLSGEKSSAVRTRFYCLKWPIVKSLGIEEGVYV